MSPEWIAQGRAEIEKALAAGELVLATKLDRFLQQARPCEHCTKLFATRDKRQKYCSLSCSSRSRGAVCSVCDDKPLPGAPWCEEHRPRFDHAPPADYWPVRVECRAREAVRRWPDWNPVVLAGRMNMHSSAIYRARRAMGISE